MDRNSRHSFKALPYAKIDFLKIFYLRARNKRARIVMDTELISNDQQEELTNNLSQ